MAGSSSIEWTDATWNPVRGCSIISPGCINCYAMRQARRMDGPGRPYEGLTKQSARGPTWTGKLRLVREDLDQPRRWASPRMIFVNSMSDLFHDKVPDEFIADVAKTMVSADWHTYQVLTKRADRLRSLLEGKLAFAGKAKHIWWGVSAEDREHGLPRVEQLRRAPAAVRFLSLEPLLEDLGHVDLDGIHWVIVGGESGPKARPMKREWVISVRDQCQAASVPFFFKQWGGVRKKAAGRELDGRTYNERPTVIAKK